MFCRYNVLVLLLHTLVRYALDGGTGALKWKYSTAGNLIYSSPAIGADGTVYIGSLDNNV